MRRRRRHRSLSVIACPFLVQVRARSIIARYPAHDAGANPPQPGAAVHATTAAMKTETRRTTCSSTAKRRQNFGDPQRPPWRRGPATRQTGGTRLRVAPQPERVEIVEDDLVGASGEGFEIGVVLGVKVAAGQRIRRAGGDLADELGRGVRRRPGSGFG